MTVRRREFIKRVGLGAVGLASSLGAPLLADEAHQAWISSSPEKQGVASTGVLEFLAAWSESRAALRSELHSFMMIRHGRVIAQGWWRPYRAAAIHHMHSLSKSVTSTGVGFAVAEGKLKLDDRVTSFFPNDLPSNASDNLSALRVRDLLTMSVGHVDGSNPITETRNWVKSFLAMPIVHPPGSIFIYDPGATYMLSAIVQKVCGQRLVDYLQPRLFEPLNVSGMTWETCPLGISTGGWGLSVTTETVAKFGQFYLQKGQWGGKQLLPTWWVDEATTFQIQQPPDANAEIHSDWNQGYGFQFWRCRHNAYRGDGAAGQFCIVMPDQDAVIAITGETGDIQGLLNLVWDLLLPAMHEETLPEDAMSEERLRSELSSLTLPLATGTAKSSAVSRVSGKVFQLEPNSLGALSVSFRFQGGSCLFTLRDKTGSHAVQCGLNKWKDGTTDMPGTPPDPPAERPPYFKVAGAAVWQNDRTLEMRWRFYEMGHGDTVTCRFDGDQVTVEFLDSIAQTVSTQAEARPILKGRFLSA
jgi:CubicO group peptidase (beta-lactamase class C family)